MAFKNATRGRHHTNSRGQPTITIGDYAPKEKDLHIGVDWRPDISHASQDRAIRLARKRGWAVRSHRTYGGYIDYVKCFNPTTGDTAFATNTAKAIWGLFSALSYRREFFNALLAIYKEKT